MQLPRVEGYPEFAVTMKSNAGRMHKAADLWLGKRNGFGPGVPAGRLPNGDAEVVLGVGCIDVIAVGKQSDDAETDGRGKRLHNSSGYRFDECKVPQTLDDECAPFVDERQIDRPAGKEDLAPCGLQNLVSRDDNSPVRLPADTEAILVGGA